MPALLRCFPGIFLFSPKNFKIEGQPRRFRQDWPLFGACAVLTIPPVSAFPPAC